MNTFVSNILSLETPFNMIVMLTLFGCTAGVLITMVTEIRKYFVHRELMELKRELAGHGMSADEIERVIKAEHKAAI